MSFRMKTLTLLLILVPCLSFGQDLSILIQDAETKAPLPYANIYFKKLGLGASTNRAGLAYLDLTKLLDQDTMVISYIGYDLKELPYTKQVNKTLFKVGLVSSAEVLTEVIIESGQAPKPEKVIRKAIRNKGENYATAALIHEALYRETLQENGQYIQLNEALTKTYYSAYTNRRLNAKLWRDWYYEESYAFATNNNSNTRPLPKDLNAQQDQQIILAARHSKNWSKYGVEMLLMEDPFLLFTFDKIKYQYDFLNPSLLNHYQFQQENTEVIKGEDCYVISFIPKANKTWDSSRKNRNAVYIGRMYLTKASFALIKCQYKLAVDRKGTFFEGNMPLDYQVAVHYKKQGDFYTLDRIQLLETQKAAEKPNGESVVHTTTKSLFILATETTTAGTTAEELGFQTTRFLPGKYYQYNHNPDYWQTIQFPTFTQLSPGMIADLEAEQPLEIQFDHFRKEKK